MTSKGKVSVIIPAYNEEKHIAKCIESILKQTYPSIEIIVVDDGSTDGTKEIVKKYANCGVRLIAQAHLGTASARNRGANEASGGILVFVDADQELDAKCVEELIKSIMEGRTVGTAYGVEVLVGNGYIAKCGGAGKKIEFFKMQPHSFVFRAIRRDAFMKINAFNGELGYFDDHSLYQKLKIGAEYVPTAICYHCVPESISKVFTHAKWVGKGYSIRKLRLLRPSFTLRHFMVGFRPIITRVLRFSFPLIAVWPTYAIFWLLVALYPPIRRLAETKDLRFALTYFIYQFVESAGWLCGFFGSLLRLYRSPRAK